MIQYWYEKYGVEGIQEYCPLLAKDPLLAAAISQYQSAKYVIESRMKELRGQVPEDEE